MLNTICLINFTQKSSLRVSLLWAYSRLSLALGLALMVLDVLKNPKPSQMDLDEWAIKKVPRNFRPLFPRILKKFKPQPKNHFLIKQA